MSINSHKLNVVLLLCIFLVIITTPALASNKKKLLVVSSYHREYVWTQETNQGLCAALKEYGYFDSDAQIIEFTKSDEIETPKMIMKKIWMNTKKKKSAEQIASIVKKVTEEVRKFKPDIILLGDDNAARYIGNQFLDSKTPIVFWGVNNTPVKYGLLDSIDRPGHNVTGVYQAGYYAESMELLTRIVPKIKTFAVLSDDTSSGRSHTKKIERLVRSGIIKNKLVEISIENNYDKWQKKALELQNKVDAFLIAQYSGLTGKDGKYVSTQEVTKWYLNNIKIPETVIFGQFVKQGMLCSADDSGYNQGYSAAKIALDILENGKVPATYKPIFPKRGALMVNKKRAKALGITFTEDMGIEEYH